MAGGTCDLGNNTHDWIPKAAMNYVEHTVLGRSIRAVARAENCHPSTILRQVRRLETRRDDPLVDAALASISSTFSLEETAKIKGFSKMYVDAMALGVEANVTLPQVKFDQERLLALRRLSESGAVLAVARDMESAVVVRETSDGHSLRTAVVDRSIAQAMALQDWIKSDDPNARIARYFLTFEGQRALRELTAKEENIAAGLVQTSDSKRRLEESERPQGARYGLGESPIMGLARRKDKEGIPFLTQELVAAGERLRQDYEVADINVADSDQCLAVLGGETNTSHKEICAARTRLKRALEDLGPGLTEVAMECCCFLNGLEVTEKKMGWSSGSGKIVLRIALTRLQKHYEETHGRFAPMIG